jgi:hypothetical protein
LVSAGVAALIFGLEPDCSGGRELSLMRHDCPEPPARSRQDVKPQAELRRHCEERSDEAIQVVSAEKAWFALLRFARNDE